MSTRDDGGPAFPHRGLNSDGCTDIIEPGMTLRDWFAGQALAGMLANPNCGLSNGSLARRSYNIADAMLAARKGGSQ